MKISANSPMAFRPATPAADAPAASLGNVDRYEGPARRADDPKPGDDTKPGDTSKPQQPTVEDAKAHLQQAASEVGRFLLAPIDAAIKTVDFAKYYVGLLQRAVVDTGTAVKELVQVSEREATERK